MSASIMKNILFSRECGNVNCNSMSKNASHLYNPENVLRISAISMDHLEGSIRSPAFQKTNCMKFHESSKKSFKNSRYSQCSRISNSYLSVINMEGSNSIKGLNLPNLKLILNKMQDFNSLNSLNFNFSKNSEPKFTDTVITNSIPSNTVASIVLNEFEESSEVTIASENAFDKREWNLTRLAVWGSIIFTFYFLRSFLGIIFGTMVLSMLSLSIVAWAENKISIQRRIYVSFLYLLVLSFAVAFFIKIFPSILQESTLIVNNLQTDKPYVVLIDSLRRIFGESFANQLDDLVFAFVKIAAKVPSSAAATGELQSNDLIQAMLQKYGGKIIPFVLKMLSFASKFIIQSALSLLFSFLVVWDFPEIKKAIKTLKNSKIKIFYEEIAPVASSFGITFQRGLKAQAMIAVINTLLTAGGLLALQLNPLVQLSCFVFICSFVPIAGVFVSTIPIGIIALADSGLFKLCLVILMVILIHAVEAYILNPTIYSAHLSLHPIMALAVLFIAEHSLGVWGLLLAVPVASFLIDTLVWGQTLDKSKQSN